MDVTHRIFYLFILLASPTYYKYIRVIKQNKKEKVAGSPQQRKPATAGRVLQYTAASQRWSSG